ncbi:RNA polymerase subunit sigma [Rhizobium rhizosphaerae]|uniref:RNA polymerase subunit sigma n=1 Tax=Xaviernesmea rhizosphaerae TaxID=1672749 RepID=A0ABX3PFY7_9HYPH|nr:sigma-70 family RNA polymerase sigma factor [Xaviernesmea rhizosphaerae]OQP87090.1 RNA polymerase subunit sigma [Xaviernesmea rhizosphaerae]
MGEILDEIADCVPALRRYARALTHNRDGADDLVQDCLERAIRKRSLWRPIGPIRPWLFRILLNLHRNELRHLRRNPTAASLDEFTERLATPGSQFEHAALAETARAMERLPDEQREALLLVAVEGLDYRQAAEVLEIPVGTLMSRLGRARTALRQMTSENGRPVLKAIK